MNFSITSCIVNVQEARTERVFYAGKLLCGANSVMGTLNIVRNCIAEVVCSVLSYDVYYLWGISH